MIYVHTYVCIKRKDSRFVNYVHTYVHIYVYGTYFSYCNAFLSTVVTNLQIDMSDDSVDTYYFYFTLYVNLVYYNVSSILSRLKVLNVIKP